MARKRGWLCTESLETAQANAGSQGGSLGARSPAGAGGCPGMARSVTPGSNGGASKLERGLERELERELKDELEVAAMSVDEEEPRAELKRSSVSTADHATYRLLLS
mmetsp:Transcript_18449/g.42092  ORF Transcript_18449/g.42092 Transcript_18449/m.42092 type:complete len:107 (-) Transcript_18449:109-429(-)